MTVAFYLNPERKQNLYCRIGDGSERATFSLGYTVDDKMWDKKKGRLNDDDPHCFTLLNLQRHLETLADRYRAEGKDQIPARLKNHVAGMTIEDGIDGIDRALFNLEKPAEVPDYDAFVKAFEQYSGLHKGQYAVEAVQPCVYFHAKGATYKADTYAGETDLLKGFIERQVWDELAMSDFGAWDAVFMDDGLTPPISKASLFPAMLRKWNAYWADTYAEARSSTGRTDHLDRMKEDSWRAFQVFMACYETSDGPVELADNLSWELPACVILAMFDSYDTDTCLAEYCEYFFSEEGFEAVDVDDDTVIFFSLA